MPSDTVVEEDDAVTLCARCSQPLDVNADACSRCGYLVRFASVRHAWRSLWTRHASSTIAQPVVAPALAECPACGKSVSTVATSCPGCGHPMRAQTIEQTGKEYKAKVLAGVVLILLGGFSCVVGAASEHRAALGIGWLAGLIGVTLYVAGRVGAWWHHG